MCNLASLNLSAFVDEANRTYDFKRLYEVTKVVTRNLNKVIDVNFYPVIEVSCTCKAVDVNCTDYEEITPSF